MSKPKAEPDDWSPQSEALFDSARGAYAPTEADRARVREALSQKLAAAAGAPAAGGDAQPRLTDAGAGSAALGNLVKAGLGLACVMAGAFALMRASEPRKQPEAKSIATQAPAPAAKPAQRAPEPEVAAAGAAAAVEVAPASPAAFRPEVAEPARAAPRRSRAQPTAAKVSVSEVTPARSEANATDLGQPVFDERAPPAGAQPSLAATPSKARSRPDEPLVQENTAEARAELAFVARINAAVRTSTPRTVLALCAEHERRWPHGTFEQEREGLRAVASCNSQAIGAAARAQTFLASHPHGPLAVRVRDECASQLAAAAAAEKR